MSQEQAETHHSTQTETFAATETDMVTALTMINCVHSAHFKNVLQDGGNWLPASGASAPMRRVVRMRN